MCSARSRFIRPFFSKVSIPRFLCFYQHFLFSFFFCASFSTFSVLEQQRNHFSTFFFCFFFFFLLRLSSPFFVHDVHIHLEVFSTTCINFTFFFLFQCFPASHLTLKIGEILRFCGFLYRCGEPGRASRARVPTLAQVGGLRRNVRISRSSALH